MNFGANKTPVEIIKGGAFGGTYFRDIYSSVNNNWYKKSWKEFYVLENIDQKYYCSDYYDIIIILFFIIFYSFSHKKELYKQSYKLVCFTRQGLVEGLPLYHQALN